MFIHMHVYNVYSLDVRYMCIIGIIFLLSFILFFNSVGSIITQDPESINVTILTSDFTLTCVAIGIPVPFITWSHNDSVVNEGGVDGEFENGLFIITTEELGTITSVLTINTALANHTGEYFCNATSTVSFYESVMSQVSLVLVQGE